MKKSDIEEALKGGQNKDKEKQMENKMKEVAKMFEVELYEPFNIVGDNYNPYKFTLEGLTGSDGNVYPISQHDLLLGRLQIKKLPFKPKQGDKYYYVTEQGKIYSMTWRSSTYDYNFFNAGNCFRTEEEITQKDIDRIVKEMKGKYENEI